MKIPAMVREENDEVNDEEVASCGEYDDGVDAGLEDDDELSEIQWS